MKKNYKKCPFCANEIKKDAIKCQYCKKFLECDIKKQDIKKSRNSIKNNIKDVEEMSKFKIICKKAFDVICIIFAIKDKRITLGRGFLLYILTILGTAILYFIIAGVVGLFVLPFGVNIIYAIEMGDYNRLNIIPSLFFLIILWGYILPKRAHDHGNPGFMGIIPIINIWYMWMPGDKGTNKYGDKPSLIDELSEYFGGKNIYIMKQTELGKND